VLSVDTSCCGLLEASVIAFLAAMGAEMGAEAVAAGREKGLGGGMLEWVDVLSLSDSYFDVPQLSCCSGESNEGIVSLCLTGCALVR
jgi:hypothetical protein